MSSSRSGKKRRPPLSLAEELRRREEDERVKEFYSLVVERVLSRVSENKSLALSPSVTTTLEQVNYKTSLFLIYLLC